MKEITQTRRLTGRLVKDVKIPRRNAMRSMMYPLGLSSNSVWSQS